MTVDALRILKERQTKISQEQKLVMMQGFTSGFWKLMSESLRDTHANLLTELETCQSVDRIRTLQGEIAALHVLLDWAEVYKKS